MKLRNKKTGEIFDALIREKGGGNKYSTIVCDIEKYSQPPLTRCILGEYDSLAKLYEEWEDYEPVEPIFDEKIRRGIRAWWDMQDNPFKNAAVLLCNKSKDRDGFYHWRIFGYIRNGEEKIATDMEFRTKKLYDYNPSHDYTKEELCGEEEE